MSVYTRTGDKGKTSFYQGKRISKANLRVDTYGSLDEANSAIGLSISKLRNLEVRKELVHIQNDLFEIGAGLANPGSKINEPYFLKRVGEFEKLIDNLTKKLPQLNSFILPGGGLTGSQLHLARTITRRAERKIVELSEKEEVNSAIIIFINRLSDLLFMYARFINYKEKKKENKWNSR